MKIEASYEPINISKTREDPFYEEMYSTMQLLGLLMPFSEKINWDQHYGELILGDTKELKKLKKTAAKNDGLFLWYAQLNKNTIFKQLILHPLVDGYLLPLHFDAPFSISSTTRTIHFCSAYKLLDECSWLEMELKNKKHTDLYKFWEKVKLMCETSTKFSTPVRLKIINE